MFSCKSDEKDTKNIDFVCPANLSYLDAKAYREIIWPIISIACILVCCIYCIYPCLLYLLYVSLSVVFVVEFEKNFIHWNTDVRLILVNVRVLFKYTTNKSTVLCNEKTWFKKSCSQVFYSGAVLEKIFNFLKKHLWYSPWGKCCRVYTWLFSWKVPSLNTSGCDCSYCI